MSVVLPLPLLPQSVMYSPCSIARVIAFSAFFSFAAG